MTDFSQTLIRCSAIGHIMCEPKAKSPFKIWEDACESLKTHEEQYEAMKNKDTKTAIKKKEAIDELKLKIPELGKRKDDEVLSETCKTYLKEVYAWQKYGKKPYFQSRGNKFTEKGILAEPESINILNKLEGTLYEKADYELRNLWLIGHPDIIDIEDIKVLDIKTSWDIRTFLANLGEPLCEPYWWQMQGYLALSGFKTGEIHYVLASMPESMFNDESRKLFNSLEVATEENFEYKLKLQELYNTAYFEDMPLEDRRIKFIVERDDAAIEKIYKRVESCRKYLCEIEKMHVNLNAVFSNTVTYINIQ